MHYNKNCQFSGKYSPFHHFFACNWGCSNRHRSTKRYSHHNWGYGYSVYEGYYEINRALTPTFYSSLQFLILSSISWAHQQQPPPPFVPKIWGFLICHSILSKILSITYLINMSFFSTYTNLILVHFLHLSIPSTWIKSLFHWCTKNSLLNMTWPSEVTSFRFLIFYQ